MTPDARAERAAVVAWLLAQAKEKARKSIGATRNGELVALVQQGVYEFAAHCLYCGDHITNERNDDG